MTHRWLLAGLLLLPLAPSPMSAAEEPSTQPSSPHPAAGQPGATRRAPPSEPIVYPWAPAQGDGTFRNPIICADYSDPDVVRDGDDFYLVASSFNHTPGLPILHSRDLVNWTIVNHALKNLPDPRYAQVQQGQGVWAPAIRKHAGKFWIFFPTPDEGIYLTTATDPRGEWSAPHLVQAGKGLIDPCPLWDDDGNAYLVHAYARSRAGIKHILRVRPMAADGSKLLGDGQIVYNDPENQPTLEGPKFHKRNGYYYISAPAGGVATGWQLILRSRNVYGPYEPKIVLEQGSTDINGPHQGALVDTPGGGEWWFVHFQDAGAYGRITRLEPVRWDDGWPLMGVDLDGNGVGEPVTQHRMPTVGAAAAALPATAPQTSDEFDGTRLGLQWQWHANHADDWHSLTAKQGALRLRPLPTEDDVARVPNLLLQKFPAREFSVETHVQLATAASPSIQAGLVVNGRTHAALVLERSQAKGPPRVVLLVNNERTAEAPLASDVARLRVDVHDGGRCTFSFAAGDGVTAFKPIGQPFQASKAMWTGATVGLFCRTLDPAQTEGHADFDYFRFAAPASERAGGQRQAPPEPSP